MNNVTVVAAGSIVLPLNNAFSATATKIADINTKSLQGLFVHGTALGDDAIMAAAKQNIETFRKQEHQYRLQSFDGKSLSNVNVHFKLKQHAFPFGDTNASFDGMLRADANKLRPIEFWQDTFLKLFNSISHTCYWTEKRISGMIMAEEYQGNPQLDSFEKSLNWASVNGLRSKLHPLFWPTTKAVPAWLLKYDQVTQQKFLEIRVRNLVSRFKDRLTWYDAVNEMLWEPSLKNLKDRNWPHLESIDNLVADIAPIIKNARQEHSEGLFLLNDYGIDGHEGMQGLKSKEGNLVTPASQRKRYLNLISSLKKVGAAPNAIGIQAHSGMTLSPSQIWEYLDDLAQAGLPLHITEFWIFSKQLSDSWLIKNGFPKVSELTEQEKIDACALYAYNYNLLCFGKPEVDAFFWWGFIEQARDKNKNYDNYILTSFYDKIYKLYRQEWDTEITLLTDAEGKVKFRGFKGDYQLIVKEGSYNGYGKKVQSIDAEKTLRF